MKSISVWQTLAIEPREPWWKRLGRWVTDMLRRPSAARPSEAHAVMLAQGKDVFARHGCAVCHGPEGRGGIRNPNAAMFQEVPPLVYSAFGFTKEELKEKIRQGATPARLDPAGPGPERWMPAWHPVLDDAELDALVEYLMSLAPKEEEKW